MVNCYQEKAFRPYEICRIRIVLVSVITGLRVVLLEHMSAANQHQYIALNTDGALSTVDFSKHGGCLIIRLVLQINILANEACLKLFHVVIYDPSLEDRIRQAERKGTCYQAPYFQGMECLGTTRQQSKRQRHEV